MKKSKKLVLKTFTNVIWKEDKYFVALCLNVGVSSFGITYEEAMKNLQEVVELYLEDAPQDSITPVEMPSLSLAEFRQQYA